MPAGPWGCAPLAEPPLQAAPSAASVKVAARAAHGRADSPCPLLVSKSIFRMLPENSHDGHTPVRLADAGLDFGLEDSREDGRMALKKISGQAHIRTQIPSAG